MTSDHPHTINPNDILVGERLRPLDPECVAELERSITTLGLQIPITIRYVEGKPTLIAGAHRLQAVKNIGWSEIPVRVFEGDEREARMWEIAENLHRAELTALERSEQTAEWIRLAEECDAAQVDPHQSRKAGQQPGGINQASRDLGIERKAAQRAVKIDSLSDEAKVKAVELGLDDNQSALLEAAKAETVEEQIEALQERKRKRPLDRPIVATPSEKLDQFKELWAHLTKDEKSEFLCWVHGREEKLYHRTCKLVATARAAEVVRQHIAAEHATPETETEAVAAQDSKLKPGPEAPAFDAALDITNAPVPELQTEVAMGEAEPAQDESAAPKSSVEQPGDQVSRIVARFEALTKDRQKYCQDRLGDPEDAINMLKGHEAWSDVRNCLVAFVALSATEQAAFRAQVGVVQVAAEAELQAVAA